jgi:glycosyltransferase involved in cell wall biosynthesis
MALQAQLLEKLLRRDGHSVIFFPSNFHFPQRMEFLRKVPGLRTLIRAILICPKLLRQARCAEVVHILAASWSYFFLVVYPAVLVAWLCGKRIILNYRGGEAKRFFRFYGWAARPIFALADAVTTPSEFLAQVIGNRFQIPVSIIPNILDNGTFQYRKRTTVQPKMLITRHLEKIYDIETALKAFRVVQEHFPDASLWIAGTGSQEEHLLRLVGTWSLRNVRFLGPVAHQDLPSVYDKCDILLNASRVDNFPGALIEASAAGLVVISTCAGGIPFIYQNGKNAFLVEPGDVQGLALAVERALESPASALAMATQAANLVQTFDWTVVRRSLYRAYGFPLEAEQENLIAVSRREGVNEA